ncbi:uncharacterized protein LOC123699916 [Colias croceus]|uniref:uncharacterized protein LOC123699916 n=1 Tax=Colias crocea TaxID=72248 RepID=UPI001E27BB06|nr:uncharacterized protein LOC123699916 [Colias croceus]
MNNLKPRASISEEMFPLMCHPSSDYRHSDDINITREVFRNKTTAVEVIVKQANKNKKCSMPENTTSNVTGELYAEIEILKNKLHKANTNLDETRKCFNIVLCEVKKQLEAANQRELKRQTKNLLLQLEKEKLKALLDSKSNLVRKLKKELLSMRRILKFVIKGMHCIPDLFVDAFDEYSEFEKDLQRRSASEKNTNGFESLTLDSILSSKI